MYVCFKQNTGSRDVPIILSSLSVLFLIVFNEHKVFFL